MAIQSIEFSVQEIQDIYGIKQSTAYKWKKFLRDNDLEINKENCDRINSREIVMESVAIVQSEPEPLQQHQPTVNHNETVNPFGLTVGRFQELNSEAELEVMVKSRLKEYHESKLQSQRSQELSQRSQEVATLDPKDMGNILKNLGIA
ncbi:hypothetical protein [Planktothrix agardhii]|uniref:hypothetical protein n=1 Tax=Planktothrix agardhii TaxID=1160 RepID=UPI00040AB674|nr:hypothetical protein [Planktothrix agardhii]